MEQVLLFEKIAEDAIVGRRVLCLHVLPAAREGGQVLSRVVTCAGPALAGMLKIANSRQAKTTDTREA